jgi:hypothetical protein
MRVPGGAMVSAALLLLFGHAGSADELTKAQSALAALRTDLQSDRIVRTEIFFMSYTLLTPLAVTPEMLEGSERITKLSVELSAELRGALIQAIDRTKLYFDGHGADLRWGAIFFDKAGTRLHSIYLNSWYRPLGAGRRGSIGGVYVQLSRSLIVWFETNFGADVFAPHDIEHQR